VYNYYITLSNKSALLTLCVVKNTRGKQQNYTNKEIIVPVAYFVMFLSEEEFVFLGSATISDRNCRVPEDKRFVRYMWELP
jgi:hypothetical protein